MGNNGKTKDKGRIFNIQRFSLHDGPGIRTLVFFKGCPLHCLWCSNPESQSSQPELAFVDLRCTKCGRCKEACPDGAISMNGDKLPVIDYVKCTACGKCVDACPEEAFILYGKDQSADEIIDEVQRDESYYRGGGGITLSGGEVLAQAGFAARLLKACKDKSIATAIETTGYGCSKAAFEKLLDVTDLVLFDLKHMDDAEHKRLVGISNKIVKERARLVVARGANVLFRMPLIPGVNDTPENIEQTAAFLRELQGDNAHIELMPYHRLGVGKYKAIGKPYQLEKLSGATREDADRACQDFVKHKVKCTVSG